MIWLYLIFVSVQCEADVVPNLTLVINSKLRSISCILTDDSLSTAIAWKLPTIRSVPASKYTFNGIRNDVDCEMNVGDSCLKNWINSGQWQVTSSVNNIMFWSHHNKLELDYRWENIPITEIRDKYVLDPKVISEPFQLQFSVLTSRNVILQFCAKNKGCVSYTIFAKDEVSDVPYDGASWEHYVIETDASKFHIRTENDTHKLLETSSEYEDIRLTSLTIFGSKNSVSLWKFYRDSFIFTENATETQIGPQFDLYFTHEFCISFFLKSYIFCKMELKLVDSNNTVVESVIYESDDWMEQRFLVSRDRLQQLLKSEDRTYRLLFRGIGGEACSWAIDDVRECEERDIRSSDLSFREEDIDQYECYSPKYPKYRLRASSAQFIQRSDSRCSTTTFGTHCISCSLLEKGEYFRDRYCKGYRVCNFDANHNNKCTCTAGFQGSTCEEACVGSYGFDCRNKCGECLNTCNAINGDCDACKDEYLGRTCKIPPLPTLKHHPKIRVSHTYISMELENKEHDGLVAPSKYIFQYKKRDEAWQNSSEYDISDLAPKDIIHLLPDTEYTVRGLFRTQRNGFEDHYVKEKRIRTTCAGLPYYFNKKPSNDIFFFRSNGRGCDGKCAIRSRYDIDYASHICLTRGPSWADLHFLKLVLLDVCSMWASVITHKNEFLCVCYNDESQNLIKTFKYLCWDSKGITLNKNSTEMCPPTNFYLDFNFQSFPFADYHLEFLYLLPNTEYNFAIKSLRTNTTLKMRFKTRQGVPKEVQNLKESSITPTSVRLTWEPPYVINGDIKHYKILYKHERYLRCYYTEKSTASSGEIRTKNTTIILDGLIPFSEYVASVKAVTISEGAVRQIKFKTQPTAVPNKDELPQLNLLERSKSVSVYLIEAKCHKRFGPLLYTLRLCCKDEWCTCETKDVMSTTRNVTYAYFNIQAFSTYSLEVDIQRPNGKRIEGILGQIFTTRKSVPTAVRNLTVFYKTAEQVFLRWLPPQPPSGEIEEYLIEYNCETFNSDSTKFKPSTCELWPEFLCFELNVNKSCLNTPLTIKMRARNKEVPTEYGPVSIINTTARIEKPEAPRNFCAAWDDNYNLTLSWTHSNTNRSSIGFKIRVFGEADRYFKTNEKQLYIFNITNATMSSRLFITLAAENSVGESTMVSLVTYSPPKTPTFTADPYLVMSGNVSAVINIPKLSQLSNESYLHVVVSETIAANNSAVENVPIEDLETTVGKQYDTLWTAKEFLLGINSGNEEMFTLGSDEVQYSEKLKQNLTNRILKPGTNYNVTFLLSSTFHNKTRSSVRRISFSTIQDNGVKQEVL